MSAGIVNFVAFKMKIKSLICIAVLSLTGCSRNAEVTGTIEAQTPAPTQIRPVKTDAVPPPVEAKPAELLVFIGTFRNIHGDGEHSWGYSVDLWRQGDILYGMIDGSNDLRLAGDPPAGVLEDVRFEPKSGKLAFKSRLSTGVGPDGKPTRDIYEFAGVLIRSRLAGVIRTSELSCGRACNTRVPVVLKRSKESSELYEGYKTLDELNDWIKKILDFRGPRW